MLSLFLFFCVWWVDQYAVFVTFHVQHEKFTGHGASILHTARESAHYTLYNLETQTPIPGG